VSVTQRRLVAALGVLLAASAPAAEDDPCAKVRKALENVFTTPAHVYTKEASSLRGTTETEAIYLDGKAYLLMHGRWTLNPESAVSMADRQRKRRKDAAMACKLVGEEKVDGRTTTVYLTSRRTSDSQADAKMWIDKASGLLLKQEEEMTAGPDNTVQRSSRYEYGNVRAPELPSH
jgi:hypothetical protein